MLSFAGDRGRAGRSHGRRLRHVLRDLAAVRPGRYPVHPVRAAVRFLGRARAPAADPQAEQVQNYIDGHSDMSRRHDVLRGHSRRAHERLLREKRESDRGPGGPGSGAAGRGGLRARVVDAVAPARGILRAADPARVAASPARARAGRGGRGRRGGGRRGRGHGRAAGRRDAQRAPRGAVAGPAGAGRGRRRGARLTRAGARAAARAGRRRAAAAARTAARAVEPTQAHLIIFTLDVRGTSRCVSAGRGATRRRRPAARPRRFFGPFFRVLETFDVFTGVFCIRVAEALVMFVLRPMFARSPCSRSESYPFVRGRRADGPGTPGRWSLSIGEDRSRERALFYSSLVM